ncbi:MAG: glycosyltransferase family 4 protein [bacterium]
MKSKDYVNVFTKSFENLTKDEKLNLSSDIFKNLLSDSISDIDRKILLNKYREITHDLTGESPNNFDPYENIKNLGIDKIYSSNSDLTSKILNTIKKIKSNDIVYRSDQLDLYNYINSLKNDDFVQELKKTPDDMIDKYGDKKTTESRFNYLNHTLKKNIFGKRPSKVRKILRVSHDYNRNQGGLQEHLQELNKGLIENHKLEIYQVLPITENQFQKLVSEGKIVSDGKKFRDVNSNSYIKPIYITQEESERMARLNRKSVINEYMNQFNDIMDEVDPDVVHVHNGYYKPHMQATKIAKSRGKKVIHTWHGGKINPKDERAKKRLQDTFNETSKYADSNFAISRSGKEAFNVDDVEISYGLDLKNYDPKNVSQNKTLELRNKFGFNNDDYVFFFPGRYHDQKNQHTLIKAFEKVANNNKKAKLLLAGQQFDDNNGSSYINNLKQVAQQYGLEDRIIFHDKVEKSDIPLFYNLSNAVIYPSKNEGRGRSLIEAMAMGKTVLASNDAGLRDSIETKDGNVGYLFDPDKHEDIAKKMNECMTNKKKSSDFAQKAKYHAHKNLSIDAYVKKYNEVYNA